MIMMEASDHVASNPGIGEYTARCSREANGFQRAIHCQREPPRLKLDRRTRSAGIIDRDDVCLTLGFDDGGVRFALQLWPDTGHKRVDAVPALDVKVRQ